MIQALSTFRVRPSLPEPLAPLVELAHNMRWSWDRPTRELFRWTDPETWEASRHNPFAVLASLPQERLDELARDEAFLAEMRRMHDALVHYRTEPRWAQSQDPPLPAVAYFSPEFGLTSAMQVYSGGLGVLAGDHLKAASDLGLDFVGVGLLYRHGYFRQYLDHDGWQREEYPDLNPHGLPLTRLEHDGRPETVEVRLGERTVVCQIWKADVGRIPLLLVDTDVEGNDPADREITDKLYGGDREHRLRQEIVLGIGGLRALRLACARGHVPFTPDVYHSNEGHAALLQVERLRELVAEQGVDFDDAIEAARAPVLFTTHTPVPAGIDVFEHGLAGAYLAPYAEESGVGVERLLALGQHGDDEFNMAVLALRLSAAANGVSRLHGRVARAMFRELWPDVDEDEVPITSITNGVHASTWIGPEMTAVYDRHLPPGWRSDPDAFADAAHIPDDVLWRARERSRERLVTSVRRLVRAQRERRSEPATGLAWTDEVLDPEVLTIGFARRFAQYKRGTLLLSQPERLRALLTSIDRPVQFVFAGKAHPRDDGGKDLIRQLVRFASDPEIRHRFVFVEDYDMDLGAVLSQGADVWLNNPRRPYEASGTSGEKAVLNGGLHFSVLDGWWDEMYDGENGFGIGSGAEHAPEEQDALDAEALFETLERVVVPQFYDRSEGPVPRRWIHHVRRSIATLGPRVLASRMVREYAHDLYRPIATRAAELTADGHARARDLAAWKRRVAAAWPQVWVTSVEADGAEGHLRERRDATVRVELGALGPEDVRVELIHGLVDADGRIVDPSVEVLAHRGDDGGAAVFTGTFCTDRAGEYGYTARVVPSHPDLFARHELGVAAAAGRSDAVPMAGDLAP